VASLLLSSESLFRPCDLEGFLDAPGTPLGEADEPFGQARAVEAIGMALSMSAPGYDVFAVGPPGLGKHRIVRALLEKEARTRPTPPDEVYVHDFANPLRPHHLRLPAGGAVRFAAELKGFVDQLRSALPTAFEGEDYRTRAATLEKARDDRRTDAVALLRKELVKESIALLSTPMGFVLAPIKDGEVIGPDAFAELPKEDRERFAEGFEQHQQRVRGMVELFPIWDHEHRVQVDALHRTVAASTVERLLSPLRLAHEGDARVLAHLTAVGEDVVAKVSELLSEAPGQVAVPEALRKLLSSAPLERYLVNVLVDRDGSIGAPVVYEDLPTHPRLVGRVEHRAHLGALVTDFTLVRKGALHEANGGFLLLDAIGLLTAPYAWEELKRCLRGREIHIESLGERVGLSSTASLDPEPVPLSVKVVLFGDRQLYYLLAERDPDFLDLFKVQADFEEELPRDPATERALATHVSAIARAEGLRPLETSAACRVVEHASRLVEDRERLSLRTHALRDLLHEADRVAAQATHAVILSEHVVAALAARARRGDRPKDHVVERIKRGIYQIETKGAVVGQINGLAVVGLPTAAFGFPQRITARVHAGKGDVVDIERESELGGPIHSKGVMILAGYLSANYCADRPFALSASLVFEQSYGHVEGDSASAAELLALLSALAEVPILQSFAITGSVSQLGRIQPIGGVNEKIEGFFDACAARGANGDEAVIVPRTNVPNLMLREDVRVAVRERRFRVFAVETIDEALGLVTGLEAGERVGGGYPRGTVNERVQSRLQQFGEAVKGPRTKD